LCGINTQEGNTKMILFHFPDIAPKSDGNTTASTQDDNMATAYHSPSNQSGIPSVIPCLLTKHIAGTRKLRLIYFNCGCAYANGSGVLAAGLDMITLNTAAAAAAAAAGSRRSHLAFSPLGGKLAN
jgi:hypothetical protein